MEVGQTHSEHIVLTAEMVSAFAKVSGDFNPIHLDEEFAKTTAFQKPIAHGVLSSALISGILGTRFPGSGTILLEQELQFKKPLFVGETALFRLTVEHVRPDKPIVTIKCEVLNSKSELSAEGQAVVKVNR